MVSVAKPLLNPTIDAVGTRSSPVISVRWVVLGFFCLLVGMNIGMAQVAPWALAITAYEAGIWAATKPQRDGRDSTPRERSLYFAAILFANLVWSSFAASLWLRDGVEYQIVALFMLASQMLHAQAFTLRALPVALVVGGFPALTLVVLVSFTGDFEPAQRLLILGGAVGLISYGSRMAGQAATVEGRVENSRDQAIKENAEKSAFLGFISHELRTPMNGILGMAAALKRDNISAQQKERVEVLIRSGESLVQLLNDILDLSKLEAGAFSLDEKSFELGAVMRDVDALWRPTAHSKGLEFNIVVDPALPASIHGDPHRLAQIVNNLVSNACKFTGKGSISVMLSRSGDRLLIDVTDTGPGIPSDDVGRLFQPFAQTATGRSRRTGGTGLGLFICRQLATAMGGSIDVASAVGGGTTFAVSLPLRPAPHAIADEQIPIEPDLRGIRLLLIEDNITNQIVMRTLLETLGCVVEISDEGFSGVQAARAKSFDLIFMDIHLPGLDGYEAFDLLRSTPGQSQRAPVIAFTAEAGQDSVKALLDHGFASVATKPIDVRSLVYQIAAAMTRADAKTLGDDV